MCHTVTPYVLVDCINPYTTDPRDNSEETITKFDNINDVDNDKSLQTSTAEECVYADSAHL